MAVGGDVGLARVGLLLRWRGSGRRGLFGPPWRALTLALGLVLAVAVIATVAEIDRLSAVVTAVGAAILTPIWAVTTARRLPAPASEATS